MIGFIRNDNLNHEYIVPSTRFEDDPSVVELGVDAWRLFLGLGTAVPRSSVKMEEMDSEGDDERCRLGMVVYDSYLMLPAALYAVLNPSHGDGRTPCYTQLEPLFSSLI